MHGVRVLHPHQPINPLAFYPSIMAHRRDTDRSCELPLSLEADFEQIERMRAHGRHHRRQATVQYLAHDDVDPIDRSIDPLTRPTESEGSERHAATGDDTTTTTTLPTLPTLLFSSSPSIIISPTSTSTSTSDIDHIINLNININL